MPDLTIVDCLQRKFDLLLPLMNEKMWRNWAAAEAMEIGWGGVSAVVSVDTKKKELVGDFKNGGREYQPERRPEEVGTHDFMDKELGKAIP